MGITPRRSRSVPKGASGACVGRQMDAHGGTGSIDHLKNLLR